jgi:hypothetical protein
MRQPLRSVVRPLTAYVTVPGERPLPLPAELQYDVDDPYAVRLVLDAPSSTSVDWVFARDLLINGMRRFAGTGDVLVIPPHRCRPDLVRIILRSSAGMATIGIPRSSVSRFLRRTVRLVRPGTESLHIDLDKAVGELTGRTD